VLVLTAVTALVGCGGGTSDNKANSDSQIAAQIRASAQRHQREAERAARKAEQARRAKAATKTTQLSAGESLPAGSAELEGPPPASTGSGGGSGGLLSAADRSSFAQLARQLSGDEGIAVTTLGPGGPVAREGSLLGGVAWSTGKVPVAMAAISAGVGSRSDLTQAITASDNAAAERLWTALGAGQPAAAAATEQLRAAGDDHTSIEPDRLRGTGYTAFGQTAWRLTDQARFVAGMACTEAGPQVLGLMNQVVAGQRWGLGSTGNDAQFKGGWGPGVSPGSGDGWLDRQMGVTTIKGKPIAVAIATTAGDHGTGTANLTALARWVVTHVDVSGAPSRPAC
jgi:hypothetical protein